MIVCLIDSSICTYWSEQHLLEGNLDFSLQTESLRSLLTGDSKDAWLFWLQDSCVIFQVDLHISADITLADALWQSLLDKLDSS